MPQAPTVDSRPTVVISHLIAIATILLLLQDTPHKFKEKHYHISLYNSIYI